MEDVASLAHEVCAICTVPHVSRGVYICTSNRFDVVLGKAVYNRAKILRRRIGKKNSIGIDEPDDEYVLGVIINNSVFWEINHRCQVEIVVHEMCHIIDYHIQLEETGRIIACHSERWKRLMWSCGFSAREAIPVSELGIPHKYNLYCSTCDVHHHTTKMLSTRVKNGSSEAYCSDCATRLVYADLKPFNLDKSRAVG